MPAYNPETYVDVQTRISRFWSEYPDGRIHTSLESNPDHFTEAIFKAMVYKRLDDAFPSATGWASEEAGKGMAQQTAWMEVCETSAIGRALANMGYATTGEDRPSREEMEKVARHTGAGAVATTDANPNAITPPQTRLLYALAKEAGQSEADFKRDLFEECDVEHVRDLTKSQASTMIELYRAVIAAEQTPAP